MMNETTIEIGGQRIGLLFDLPATEWLNDHVKMRQGKDGMISMSVNQLSYMIEGGYKNWCMAEGQEDTISHRAFYDYAMSRIKSNDTELQRIIAVYQAANKTDDIPHVVEPEEGEKKSLSPSTGGILKSFVSEKAETMSGPASAIM